jgi:hypothetical protein
MIRSSTRIALEAVVGLVLAVVLVGAGAIWRLSEGPVSVDFLTPELEAAFTSPDSPIQIDVGRTELIWGGWDRTVDLRARDWKLIGPEGQTVAQLPEVGITLSLRALAQGVIAPTRVEVSGARMTFERDRQGRFSMARASFPAAQAEEAETEMRDGEVASLLPGLIERLLTPSTPEDPLTFLRSVETRDMTVRLIDRRFGTRLEARNASLELTRTDEGISGNAALGLDIGGEPVALEATLDYAAEPGVLRVDTAFRDLVLPEVARLAPELVPLARLQVPLDGLVGVVLNDEGTILSADFDLVSGPGALDLPRFYDEPLALRTVAAAGSFEAGEERVTVDDLEVVFGAPGGDGPTVRARVNLDLREGYKDLGIGARLDRMPVEDLARYWPRGASENGRAWVIENIAAGTATNLELVASLRVPDTQEAEPEVSHLSGSFQFSGLEAHYLRPMPPVTDIQGRAEFDNDSFVFDVAQGTANGLQVGPAEVRIFGLSGTDHQAEISFAANGPLRSALEILNHPRLRLIDKLGFDVAGSAGTLSTEARFAFPLIDELSEEEFTTDTQAQLSQVALPDAAFGMDVTDGELELDLSMTQMQATGTLRLGGLPVEADWTEYFVPRDGVRRRLTATTTALDGSVRASLGLPMAEFVEGPIAASASLTSAPDETSVVELQLGLAEAAMEIPALKWRKPAGAAGTASMTLELWGERLVALRDMQLAAGTLAMNGSATFSPEDSDLLQVYLSNFSLGATSLRDIEARPWAAASGPGWDVRIASGQLDATPWLGEESDGSDRPEEQGEPEPQTPLKLSVGRLQALTLEEGRGFEAVSLEGRRGPRGWERLELGAEVPRRWWRAQGPPKEDDARAERKMIRFTYGPAAEGGGYALEFGADDLGAALRAVAWIEEMEGGQTRLTGTSPGPLLSAPIQAQLEVRDYTLIDAPIMARIFAGASLGGLGGMLAEDNGITFERGTGALVYESGTVSTDLLRAYGPALGITARGSLDTESETLDIEGTVVPAYAINQVLGAIPILGPLLTGGEGEGVLAVTYGVDGALENPNVTVNPLSALAPGFLRGIFSGKVEGSEEALQALPPAGSDR